MKVLLIIAIIAFSTISFFLANRKERSKVTETSVQTDSTRIYGFGYNNMWFAVKANSNTEVVAALGLKNIRVSEWSKGIAAAYNDKVFVTAPIDGWVLVVGLGLGFDGSSEKLKDEKKLADKLSKIFGEAQFFSTHRVVEYHCWLRSLNGKTERAYAYIGESGENIEVFGAPTPAEAGLKLVNTFSEEAKKDDYFDDETLVTPDEELVMQIAAKWSVDLAALEGRIDIDNKGIVGVMK